MQHYPLVTIIGGSGFVGRHTVKRFAEAGYRIRVLVRDTVKAEFLKTAATIGQIVIEHADITRPETLAGKLAGSDIVVNLVSIAYESGRQKFGPINIAGAKAIAEEAHRAGAKSLVHVSSLGVDQTKDTKYGSTKFAGEQAVRTAFPNAVILRPSVIVGPEDRFIQRFARMALISPIWPLIAGGHTKFQPVLVTDVAEAIFQSAVNPALANGIYAVAGDQTYTMRELLEMISSITNRRPCMVSIPGCLASLKGALCELLPFAPMITRDQVKLLRHDNTVPAGAAGLSNLGITATPIADALPQLLARFIKA